MKGHWITYSAEERAWLRDNCTLPINEYHRAFVETFGRDIAAVNLNALRKRSGWRTGRTGQIEKGATPHNKGKPCAPGTGGRHPNAQRTQFKPGVRRGVASKLYKPVGTERLCKNGYRERKIHDGMPQSRWRAVHLIEWEAVNGPIPNGHCLKSLDGDRLNVDPANWVAVPRALLPRLNSRFGRGYDEAPAELKPVIMAVTKLEHRIRESAAPGSALPARVGLDQ